MNTPFHRKNRRLPPFDVGSLLTPDRFLFSEAASVPDVLREAVTVIAPTVSDAQEDIVARLQERERLMTTALGMGVAMPHGTAPSLKCVEPVFVILKTPLDWQAFDKRLVDIVVVTVFPEDNRRLYLAWLREVARLLRDEQSRDSLRHAESREAAAAILNERYRTLSHGTTPWR